MTTQSMFNLFVFEKNMFIDVHKNIFIIISKINIFIITKPDSTPLPCMHSLL